MPEAPSEKKGFLKKNKFLILISAGILVLLLSGVFLFKKGMGLAGAPELPEQVDFNFHIRPILSDRCFKCHGPDGNKREANLRLDTEKGLYGHLKDDTAAFVIVPGDPEHSELYLRVSASDTSYQMPPPSSHLALAPFEVELIRKWIKQGARYKKHWSLIPPEKPVLPAVKNSTWPKNEIDYFILSRLEKNNLSPAPEADKERLLKRLYIDLIGLPPTLAQQDSFLQSNSSNIYEETIDHLLDNPHFGERMAVPWMDISRYADSHGYQDDGLRTMWPWRDWVISAFNRNLPYDQFVTWQLAGDLLPSANKEQILATGFNRNHKITQEGGVIDEEYRLEYVTDRTNTFGKAFLAMTLECAKCHDHKYDPISQHDYYSLFAFFNQVKEKGYVGDITLASLADPPRIEISTKDIQTILPFIHKKDTANVQVMVMADTSLPRVTRVLKRGVYDQPADTVHYGTPAAILPFDSAMYPNNRLGLARWLFSPRNPLTARVIVNRTWQEYFGRGIVKSSGDFGMQGDLPTHPELLDWLAVDFAEHGWNLKRLIKQILMSATYRQSAATDPDKTRLDPENALLSRFSRIRLTAEWQRDLVLASSGLLSDEIGGPSVKPYQPPGIWESTTSGRGQLTRYIQDHGDKLYRRGLYTFIKRTAPPPSMLIMDASNRDQCEVKRMRTNTPLQALVLLNDPQVVEASRVLAEKIAAKTGDPDQRIEMAFRSVLCRKPNTKEMELLKQYYDAGLKNFQEQPEKAASLISAGEYPVNPEKTNQIPTATLMQITQTLYNMDESSIK